MWYSVLEINNPEELMLFTEVHFMVLLLLVEDLMVNH